MSTYFDNRSAGIRLVVASSTSRFQSVSVCGAPVFGTGIVTKT